MSHHQSALRLALASDTLSMTTMELVDNAIMVMVPGAMDAGLSDPLLRHAWLLMRGSQADSSRDGAGIDEESC